MYIGEEVRLDALKNHLPIPFSSVLCKALVGVVAQLVERLVRNEKVAGSIPVGSTIPIPQEMAARLTAGALSLAHHPVISSVMTRRMMLSQAGIGGPLKS
jgi:hypothetical protein